MGYILIGIGLLLIVCGVVIVSKPGQREIVEVIVDRPAAKMPEKEPAPQAAPEKVVAQNQDVPRERTVRYPLSGNSSSEPAVAAESKEDKIEDSRENKAKGDAFERYVVKNFNTKYFTLQEWRGDKQVDGVYAVSNHYPDLEVTFNLKSKSIHETFAIECKWRKNYYKNGIQWAHNYQIKNYKEFSQRLHMPVFVVIGVGGEPDKPEELFVIPLSQIQENTICRSDLERFRKDVDNSRFYWDSDSKELR